MPSPPWLPLLHTAHTHAQAGHFGDVAALCREISRAYPTLDAHLDGGALLLSCGLLGDAQSSFTSARALAGNDLRPLVNLANLAQQQGDHAEARRLYSHLLKGPLLLKTLQAERCRAGPVGAGSGRRAGQPSGANGQQPHEIRDA